MIKDIKELNFPRYATLSEATVNMQDMGDRTITAQIRVDGDVRIDFSYDWAVEFKGEKYIMPLREPQASKENTSTNQTADLTFYHWAQYWLKKKFFFDYVSTNAGVAVPSRWVVPLQLNLRDLCDYLSHVCQHWFGDKITVDLNPDWISTGERKPIEISYSYIWDVLIQFHDLYGVRWNIEPKGDSEHYVIKIGYDTQEVSHIFEYGFEGGLLKTERQVQDPELSNELMGRGGSKNLPYRYFKQHDEQNASYSPDPDWIPELKDIYFSELHGATFRSYVQGWNWRHYGRTNVRRASDAYAPWAWMRGYNDEKFNPVEFVADAFSTSAQGYGVVEGSSIQRYGELLGALDNNEDIYPTIQGVEIDGIGRVDEIVGAEKILSDDIEQTAQSDAVISDLQPLRGTARNVGAKGGRGEIRLISSQYFTVDSGKSAVLDTGSVALSAVISGTSRKFEDSKFILAESVSGKVVNPLTGKENSLSGIPEGTWRLEVTVKVQNTYEGSDLDITAELSDIKLTQATTQDRWGLTWDIWIKNIWQTSRNVNESDEEYAERIWRPILGDREGSEAKVMFSTGALSASDDYEFTIVKGGVHFDDSKKIGDVKSHWRLTLAKSDADLESLGVYVPSTKRQAVTGDHFFFIGIDIPHMYVVKAEERLDDWKKDALRDTKDIKPTWVVTLDKVRIHDCGRAGALVESMVAGNSLRLADKRFINGAYETLYLQSVTYSYKEPTDKEANILPDVEVVLSDKYETSANPVTRLSSDIEALQRQIGSISNVEQIVRAVGDKLYLRKDGIADRSVSSTEFASLLTSLNFRAGLVGGQGWGFFKDSNGKWVLETDRLNVREEMSVNTLVINQAEARGGMIIESAANMEITSVVETSQGYDCYFDQKGGSVANLFKVDDVAFCLRFTPENNDLKYYRRKVIAIAEDHVTLSKTISDGSGIPEQGDDIIQYGNYTDKERQYIKVRDVVGGGYERYLEDLDSVSATGTEYYFVGRQSGMYNNRPRFYIGDPNGYVKWENGRLYIKGDVTLMNGQSVEDYVSNQTSDGVEQVDVLYVQTQSRTEKPSTPQLAQDGTISDLNGWSTDAPEWRQGWYIWQITYTRRHNGTAKFSEPTCISGRDGQNGTSVTITSQSVRYSTAHSSAQPADSTFTLTSVPALSEGQYLWSMTTVTYNNGQSTRSYAVSRIGQNGQPGQNGTSVTIKSTSVTYAKTTAATQPADSAFTFASIGAANVGVGDYLWTKTVVTYSDDTTTKSYSVGRIGSDGDDGQPGAPGENGKTTYVHYAYANSADGQTGFSVTYFKNALYVGVCTDYNAADPTAYTAYQWSRLRGEDGKGIVSTQEYYAVNNDAGTAPDDSKFSTTVQQTSVTNRYLWNYEKTTYTDNTFKSTAKRVIGVHGQNGDDGTSITKVENFYLASDKASGITVSSQGWTADASSAVTSAEKPYLWNYEKITYSKGNPTTTAPHIMGRYGADGVGIDRIEEEYYLSTSRTALQGGTWSTTRPAWVAGRFYWTRSHIYYTDGADEVTDGICVTGEQGASGVSVLAQYSADAQSWHPAFVAGDVWMRTSSDGGATWTSAIRIAGMDYSPNLLLNTESPRTVTAGNATAAFALYYLDTPLEVHPGDLFAFSLEGIELLEGTATEFTVRLYNHNVEETGVYGEMKTITKENPRCVLKVTHDATMRTVLLYAGKAFATTGNTVRFTKPMLVKGDVPAQWSPAVSEMVGIDGQWRKFEWAIGTATAPTGAWQPSPMTAKAGEYVWMRSGMVVPPATTPATWEAATRLTGDKGDKGDSVYMLDLSNEVAGVMCDSSGAVAGVLPTSKASVWRGSQVVTTGVTYSIPQTSGATATVDAAGNVRITALTADNASVVVQAVVDGLTLQTTMSVYKIKPGANGTNGTNGAKGDTGEAAVAYSIEPSVDNITRSMTGELSATSVTCSVYKTTGNTARALTSEKTLTYQRIPDGATGTLAHASGTSAAVQILGDTECVIFELKDGATVLDRERIPVLSDASDLDVGGTNLLKGTSFNGDYKQWYSILFRMYNNYGPEPNVVEDTNGYNDHGVIGVSESSATLFTDICRQIVISTQNSKLNVLKPGKWFTFSFMAKGTQIGIIPTAYGLDKTSGWTIDGVKQTVASNSMCMFALTDNWTRHTLTFKTTDNFESITSSELVVRLQTGQSAYISQLKLEDGNIPTQWSPAPEDIENRVDTFDYLKEAMRNGKTTIDGGLLLSSLIKLGQWTSADESGTMSKVWAGMNGFCANDRTIASWWGGDMVDRFLSNDTLISPVPANAASALIRMDGTGYLAKGNIMWRNDGSADFAGGKLKIDNNGNLFFGSGITIVDGASNTTLGSILNKLSALNTMFIFEDENLNNVDISDPSKIASVKYIRATKHFYSDGAISALGMGDITSGGGSSGGGSSYGVLWEWSNYAESNGEVLSAKLGWDLKTRIENLPTTSVNPFALTFGSKHYDGSAAVSLTAADIGALTQQSLAGYAKLSDIPTSMPWSKITSTPTTISGYGITDAYTKTEVGNLVGAKLDKTAYTAAEVLAKIKTVDGSGSGLDADLLDGKNNGELTAAYTHAGQLSCVRTAAKNDNGGRNTYLLIADITGYETERSRSPKFGFEGFVFADRGSDGMTNISYVANVRVVTAYDISLRNLTSDNNYCTPCIVGYGSHYYMALRLRSSSHNLYFYGKFWNALDEFMQVDTPAGAELPEGMTVLYDTQENTLWNTVVTKASKLQTARTLWGQSFDGSANVSGNMTGVGNIDASGQIKGASLKIGDATITWDSANNALKVDKSLYSTAGISALGAGTVSGGSTGGGGVSYDRLDAWSDYNAGAGQVLSALLGYDLKTRIDNLPSTAPNPFALTFGSKRYDGTSSVSLSASDIGALTQQSLADYLTKASAANLYQPKGDYALVSQIPTSFAWDKVTGKPTTIGGYGITNGVTTNTEQSISVAKTFSKNIGAIADLTATANDENAWNVKYQLRFQAANNAMTISVDGTTNGRTALIQVGHYSQSLAQHLGTLHLNKLGGAVKVNDSDVMTVANYADTLGSVYLGINANAASATKLQTAHTLWGKLFDGTADVSGNLTGVGSIGTPSAPTTNIYCGEWYRNIGNGGWINETHGGGMYMTDSTWVRVYNKPLIVENHANIGPNHFNVAIKTQHTSYSGIEVQGGNTVMGLGAHTDGKWYWWRSVVEGNLISDKKYCMEFDGHTWTFRDNIYATGGVTCLSDMGMKNVTGELPLSLADVAGAPVFTYRWKDKSRGDKEQAGSSAQYWHEKLPWAVSAVDGHLTFDYGRAGLLSAVVTARETERLRDKVARLEAQVHELRLRLG